MHINRRPILYIIQKIGKESLDVIVFYILQLLRHHVNSKYQLNIEIRRYYRFKTEVLFYAYIYYVAHKTRRKRKTQNCNFGLVYCYNFLGLGFESILMIGLKRIGNNQKYEHHIKLFLIETSNKSHKKEHKYGTKSY